MHEAKCAVILDDSQRPEVCNPSPLLGLMSVGVS